MMNRNNTQQQNFGAKDDIFYKSSELKNKVMIILNKNLSKIYKKNNNINIVQKILFIKIFILMGALVEVVAQTTTTLYSNKVTLIYRPSPLLSWGNDDVTQIQMASSGADPRTRPMMEFDLSSIPSNANVTAATFRIIKTNTTLCDGSGNGGNNMGVQIRRITRAWVEGTACNATQSGSVNWNSAGPVNWTTPGGDIAATNYGAFTVSPGAANNTVYTVNVLDLVNYWRANSGSNFGLLLLPTSGSTSGSSTVNFIADEGVVNANKPQLIVTYTTPPTLSTTVTNVNCNGANNGAINLTVTGGNPPYTYLWSNGATTEDISSLTAGTYTVTVTNTGGGSATTSATVTQPAILNGTVSKTDVTCFGTNNGSITVGSPSGGSGSYQYRLNTGIWQTSGSFTGLTAGTYSVQIRDANVTTCTRTLSSQTVTQPAVLAATVSKTNITCYNLNNGTITANSPSGGSGSYQYRLNTGTWQSSGSFTGLAPGSYLVQIRDANNTPCVVELGLQGITQPASLVANGVVTNVSCAGNNDGSIVQTVSGGTGSYTYAWSGGGPTTRDRTMLSAGTYTVTITDGNNCSINRTYNIIQSTVLTLTADATQPQCGVTGSIILSISGGTSPYTFDWGDIAGTDNPQNRSNLAPGSYSVTVTDQSGCSSTGTYNLIDPNCGPGDPVCIVGNDAAVYSVASDPFVVSYIWTVSNGGVIVSGQGTPEIVVNWTGATSGEGQICVKTENDCGESAQTCKNIILKLVDAFASSNDACSGGSIELTAEGGDNFEWSGPNGFSSTLQNPVIHNATALNSGTYAVTVTDEDGCSATASVAVTVSAGFTLSVDVFDSACGQNIGALDATVTGGVLPLDYMWSNGAVTEDITDLPGGNYTLTVTDSDLCVGTIMGSIKDLEGPTLTASATNVTCNGGTDGNVSLTVSGGTPPISFIWSNGATTQNLANVPGGLYSVLAIDTFGCVGSASGFVNQPNPFQVNITRTNLSCNGSNDGSIALNVLGGTPGYTYAWSDGGPTTSSRTGLAAGPYTVTITDNVLCTAVRTIFLTQPTAIVASTTTVDVSCFGELDGVVNLSVSGGSSPYTYLWSNLATTRDLSGLSPGTYSVTVTDSKGCSTNTSAVISQPLALSLNISEIDVLCNGGSSGLLDLSVSGGNGGYTYLWSNGATTQDVSGVQAGTYTVVVVDSLGCTGTASGVVVEPTALVVSLLENDVFCFGQSTGSINVNVSGGTLAYSFAWSDGLSTASFRDNLPAGNYTVTVTDGNLCNAISIGVIEENDELSITGVSKDVLCNGNSNGQISVNVVGGFGSYTYQWSGGLPAQSEQTGLSVGTYNLTVTDELGCSATGSFTVGQPAVLAATGVVSAALCFESEDGSVDLSVTGGVSPYTYEWSSAANTEDVSALSAGSYTVTVTDLNLCSTTASFSITQPTAIAVSSIVIPNCQNQTNGSVALSVSGGTPGYTYIWTGSGSGTNPRTALGAGVYFVTVTDANQCEALDSFELIPLTLEVTGTDRTCILADGQAIASTNGGLEPYTYSWSNGGTIEFIENLDAGTYSVTVTAGSCTQTGSVVIDVPVNCDPPVPQDDFYTGLINTPLTGTVMPTDPLDPGYDSDPFYPLDSLTFEDLEFLDTLIGTLVWDSIGGFVFTPVTGYFGTFSLDYEICNPLNLCASATLTITVVGPDVTPVVTALPNVMQGITDFNLTVRVTELNNVTTNGLITVKIPKDLRLSFLNPFNPSLTQLGPIALNNSEWTYNQDTNFHIFTSSTAITGGGFSTFGFVARFDPSNAKGFYTLTAQIEGGSGGEIRIDNNVDSEKLDYFIE